MGGVVARTVQRREDESNVNLGEDPNVDGKDIFAELGATSAEATWIRGALVRALRRAGAGYEELAARLAVTIIYSNSTVERLAAWLVSAVQGSGAHVDSEADAERKVLELVGRFTSDWPSAPLSSTSSTQASKETGRGYLDTVLLTGASGALGASLLALLLSNARTERIYVFVRRSSALGTEDADIQARYAAALVRAGYDASLLEAGVQEGKVVSIGD